MSYAKHNSSKEKRKRKKMKARYFPTDPEVRERQRQKAKRDQLRKELKIANRKNLHTDEGVAVEIILFQWFKLFYLFIHNEPFTSQL